MYKKKTLFGDQAASRSKHGPLNDYVSLESLFLTILSNAMRTVYSREARSEQMLFCAKKLKSLTKDSPACYPL
jgi:hypothetical protein